MLWLDCSLSWRIAPDYRSTSHAALRLAGAVDGVPKPKQDGTQMPPMGGAQLTSSEFSCCGLCLGAESRARKLTLRRERKSRSRLPHCFFSTRKLRVSRSRRAADSP